MFFPEAVLVCFLGLVLGSFATALSWRIPRGLSWVSSRSACLSCQTKLGLADLVPVFSWLASKGRCRHCGAEIGRRYPLIELGVMAACLGVYTVYGFTVEAFLIMAALPFLAALLLIDLESMILPDSLVLAAGMIGLAALVWAIWAYGGAEEWLYSRLGGAVLYVGLAALVGRTVSFFMKKEALGWGDVKFFAVAGLWLGWEALPLFLVMGGLMGLVFGLVWRFWRHDPVFPFGPALILALYSSLLWQGIGLNLFFAI